ncbi:protein shisa-7-like [Polypterus senegalus]|uniref:protein shisa-7-like n=1 Tax=Polypterus senegalus TaxID=55291 RepID=UPI0019657E1C|nr:protein shisa-7-like [Polypterus senegalus]
MLWVALCCSTMHCFQAPLVLLLGLSLASATTNRPGVQHVREVRPVPVSPFLAHIKRVPMAEDGPLHPLPQRAPQKNGTWMGALVPPPKTATIPVGEVCWGYYDVMGHFDLTFNCSTNTYLYCCGTCNYRFCCEHRNKRLNQSLCNNYITPVWANSAPTQSAPFGPGQDPGLNSLKNQGSSTVYVIGGVLSFTLAVAVGMKVAFHKASRRPRPRDINMPRALVDILRHQSTPSEHGERNNSTVLGSSGQDTGSSHPPKNLYTPALPSKDNRIGNMHHNFIHLSGQSPKHTGTMERLPRMNNAQLASGTLLSNKHNNTSGGSSSSHPFSHSLYNLAQLPPSYESAMKPEINRYSSLKRLEKDLDDSSGYYTSKRRGGTNAPPSFHSSQHHLYIGGGGDYTLGGRGTLPLHAMRPRIQQNPYPATLQHPNLDTLVSSKPPRRVMSQDQLLVFGEGNTVPNVSSVQMGTLGRLNKNQQLQQQQQPPQQQIHQSSQFQKHQNPAPYPSQTLRKSHERLLSPDRGTLPRLSAHQKAQSQQNVCVTPSLDRHHMIKMNSHPTSGREGQQRAADVGAQAPGIWGDALAGGTGTLGHSARRMAFANKRQNTIEQLHFIPGGNQGGTQSRQMRTGSKNEVTV